MTSTARSAPSSKAATSGPIPSVSISSARIPDPPEGPPASALEAPLDAGTSLVGRPTRTRIMPQLRATSSNGGFGRESRGMASSEGLERSGALVGVCSRRVARKPEAEESAAPLAVAGLEAAPDLLGQVVAQGEAEAGSGRLGREEGVEDAGQDAGCDPRTVVDHVQSHAGILPAEPHADPGIFR